MSLILLSSSLAIIYLHINAKTIQSKPKPFLVTFLSAESNFLTLTLCSFETFSYKNSPAQRIVAFCLHWNLFD